MLDFDLASEIELLRQAEAWQTGTSRTQLVRFPDFRVSLTAMKAGAKIELHQNPGRISVQTVDGHIRMYAGDRTFDLPKVRVLALDRSVPHKRGSSGRQCFSTDRGTAGRDLIEMMNTCLLMVGRTIVWIVNRNM